MSCHLRVQGKPVILARARGFTLFELMAVVAIVAVLAALLTTALNQAKARAHQVGCLNNLRQLQWAWILYAEDNEDALPLNRSMPSANEKWLGRRNTPDSWVAGNPKEDTSTANIERGSLFPYVKSASTYRCPADPGRIKKSVPRTRSYSMSAYLNGDAVEADPRVKTRLSEVQMQPASKIFVFIEEDIASPWLGSFVVMPRERVSLASTASFASVPGSWHNGGSDVSFADGHVEFWRWSSLSGKKPAQPVSLLRQGMEDLRRLHEAVPRP